MNAVMINGFAYVYVLTCVYMQTYTYILIFLYVQDNQKTQNPYIFD